MAKRDIVVDFGAFHTATPATQHFVRRVLEHADRNLDRLDPYEVYEGFLFLWASFNNWGMRVTGAESDAEMIYGLGRSPILERAFQRIQDLRGDYRRHIEGFRRQWPIFSVLHVRRAGLYDYLAERGRDAARERLLAARVKRGPSGDYLDVRPSWEMVLEAIYIVRCNLAHGNKGEADDDHEIVLNAYRALLGFIRLAQIYELPHEFPD